MITRNTNTLFVYDDENPLKLNIHTYTSSEINDKNFVEEYIKKLGYKNINNIDWWIIKGNISIDDHR